MLVVSREVDETIEVDGPCKIVVTEIKCGRVKIGVEAWPNVKVYRGEVADARRHEQQLKEARGK